MAEAAPLDAPPYPLVENPAAPEIYFDGYWGSMITPAGVIKLNLISQFVEHETIKGRVVARVSIPAQNLVHVHEALGKLLAHFRGQGFMK